MLKVKFKDYYDDGSSFLCPSIEYNLDTGVAKVKHDCNVW